MASKGIKTSYYSRRPYVIGGFARVKDFRKAIRERPILPPEERIKELAAFDQFTKSPEMRAYKRVKDYAKSRQISYDVALNQLPPALEKEVKELDVDRTKIRDVAIAKDREGIIKYAEYKQRRKEFDEARRKQVSQLTELQRQHILAAEGKAVIGPARPRKPTLEKMKREIEERSGVLRDLGKKVGEAEMVKYDVSGDYGLPESWTVGQRRQRLSGGEFVAAGRSLRRRALKRFHGEQEKTRRIIEKRPEAKQFQYGLIGFRGTIKPYSPTYAAGAGSREGERKKRKGIKGEAAVIRPERRASELREQKPLGEIMRLKRVPVSAEHPLGKQEYKTEIVPIRQRRILGQELAREGKKEKKIVMRERFEPEKVKPLRSLVKLKSEGRPATHPSAVRFEAAHPADVSKKSVIARQVSDAEIAGMSKEGE